MTTAAFLSARTGKLTASNMWRAMSFLKSGKESEERRKYKIELLAERMTGDVVPHYVNDLMRWGLDTEPHAKAAYENQVGVLLLPCGTIAHPTIEDFCATPDSLIGRTAVFEAKCPQTTTHLAWKMAGGVPDQHKPQCLAQLACTGRSDVVFISYDPRVPERQRLFIVEWTPDPDEIAAVEAAARQFLAEVDAMWEALNVEAA